MDNKGEVRALSRLSELDERETASALGVTDRTVQRDWVKAKALLSEWMDTD